MVSYNNSKAMDFSGEAEVEAHTLKEELVPNFHLLDHNVQTEIVNILQVLVAHPSKRVIQEFSRLGLLQQAPLLRSHIWKLLLETLSPDPRSWQHAKRIHYELYRSLVDKFVGRHADETDLLGQREAFDETLWGEIQLDTRRTHSAFNFYQKEVDHTRIYLRRPTKNSDVLSRILYIWGRTNSTVRYVQGMNEILAPLYYLQFQKYNPYAESEVFFMFSSLMTFLIDMHIKDMDETEQGIMGRMRILNRYLKVVDLQLWNRLEQEKILPQYYSFRWLALLLAQEFGLYETMKLWDVMLSYDGYKRYFYLYCCCISILKYRKQVIITHDFVSILPSIQKLRDANVSRIIEIANKLYDKYSRVNIEKLYHQMNLEIDRQTQEERQKAQEVKEKWSYGNMLQKTGNFFVRMVGNLRK